ncbi:MAG: Lrp/AsnC family transcriptional regulator [Candidatus Thorarchaeota archaeon]
MEREDNTDRDLNLDLIEILRRDSRTSLREMAKLVPLSPSSIRNRISKLTEDGIIERFTVDVDWRKLGYEIQVVILVTAKPGSSEELYKTLLGYQEISKIYWTTGPANFICISRLKDMTQLSQFLTGKIEKLKGVERIETLFLMPNPETVDE